MEAYPHELLVIALAAMLAPMITEWQKELRIPVTVLEIILGILIGPHGLEWVNPDGLMTILSELGLAFLLFMVGLEIDFDRIRGRPLSLAIGGWFLSLLVAMSSMYLLNTIGLIETPPILAGIALSTTALGVIAPVLRDRGQLNSDFGKYISAAAATGEFGPLVIISMLLIPTHSTVIHTFFILLFIVLALGIAYIALNALTIKHLEFLSRTMKSSGQLPVRICILLQVALVTLAAQFGLNILIGAFTAGMLVGLTIKGEGGELLRHKLDAIGYGFLVPIFFIVAGMKLEFSALWSSPLAPLEIAILLVMLVVVRGLPVLLYRNELKPEEKVPFAFYSATGLPLIVIISEIGVASGLMPPDRASLLVSAGMISIFLFPILAVKLQGKFKIP